MTFISEAAFKKYWAVGAVVAALVAGGAVWATKVWASIERLDAGQASLKLAQDEATAAAKATSHEIRLLREAMIRAGTALDAPKGD